MTTDRSGRRVHAYLATPVGILLAEGEGEALVGLSFAGRDGTPASPAEGSVEDERVLAEPLQQLEAYFEGSLLRFTFPLRPRGTEFQKQVWGGLLRIPYGEAISYAELARRIGRPGSARAVGTANGRNPIAIIIPCHRVIAANGTLGGFGGGLDRKQWLLNHERSVAAEHGAESPALSAVGV